MVKRSFVSLWFITSQRKMQLDENRNCVVIIDFFVIDFLDSVEYFGCFCVCPFFFSSSSEIFPPLGNRSRDNSDHLRKLEIN